MDISGRRLLRRCCLRLVVRVLCLSIAAACNVVRAAEGIDYSVSVEGVKSSRLKNSIIDASQLLGKSNRPILTIRALRRRVENSQNRIRSLLRARAYYGANQTFGIERTSDKKARVILKFVLGPAYRIGRYDVRDSVTKNSLTNIDIPFKTLGLKPGDRARSDVIVAADSKLLAALGRQAYPLARIEGRRVVVDHKRRTLSVDVFVATGPRARFGNIRTEGLKDVDPEVITKFITWERGTPFDSTLLDKLRSRLRQTGLFSSILIRHAETVDSQGEIDITIGVTERKHRSIGAGGSFSTSEGLLGKLFWEHRNFWGHGERLRLRGEVGEIRQGVFADLRIPGLMTTEQDLVFDTHTTREEPDGFTSIETAATARLERRFRKIYAGSAGIGFDQSNVEDNRSDRNFTFLTLPLSLRRDTSDDLLNPSKGSRATLTFTPTVGIIGTDPTFYTARLFDSVYVPLMAEKKLILAGWARLSTIFGESTIDIPANKRIFAGGAGSVRGYALNDVGPLDAQSDPIGGRSATEFGMELRWRAFGPLGLVSFAEAGGVYNNPAPNWGKDLQWGAGLGVRYFTNFGPLRLDVAVPLNRRNSVDDSFQILVSLGQAF